MKNTITELCKREGKKTQVQIGNVREVMKAETEMIAEELAGDQTTVKIFTMELERAITKKVHKLLIKNKKAKKDSLVSVSINLEVHY